MKFMSEFSFSSSDSNKFYYTCTVVEGQVTKSGVTSYFGGNHLPGKSDEDVEMILYSEKIKCNWHKESPIEHFPSFSQRSFLNLKVVQIFNCGLEEITRKDLVGLESLEGLYLHGNKLRSLPTNLFIGMRKLNSISICDDRLYYVSSKMLQPIAKNDFKLVKFSRNSKIDALYQPGKEGSVASLQELMIVIDEEFERPAEEANEEHNQNFITGIKEMWQTKNFSDLTIIAGRATTKEFEVHKNIFGTQSSVFAATFMNEMKEKMTIDDFTADVVEEMLQFFYSGQLKDNSNAMDLFAIAAKYDVTTLKNACEKLILCNIDEFNALEVFALGYLHNTYSLKRAAFEQIQKMFPDEDLDESEMEKLTPEELKKIIDAHRKLQEAQAEMGSKLKKIKRSN
jgi:BTB/POZ domain